jgi:DNA polymerase III delta prime subunit
VNVPFLLLSGPPGVGKTTASWQIFDQLVEEGERPALVDLDLLGASWPVPDDDPHNERLKARNLGAMWQNFYASGVRCLIAAGVVETRENLDLLRDAVPGAVTALCRLRAGDHELAARISGRGRERGDGAAKLAHRARQLSAQMEAHDVADLVVDTDNHSIAEVARLVRSGADWPGRIL